MSKKFNYAQIQGVKGNLFVTQEFIEAVEKMAERLKTKPEYILASMSFETGGTFNPALQNAIGATGLIQFTLQTAPLFGTTTAKLKNMTAVEQLEFVEKYLGQYKGKLDTLEAVYTSILSGAPKKPDEVLFRAGTKAYNQNPLDWNKDGGITAREATTPVAARLFGGITTFQKKLLETGQVPDTIKPGFDDGRWGKNTSDVLRDFQKSKGLPETGLLDETTGQALFPDTQAEEAKTSDLKIGDKNDEVKHLQETLVKLGLMTQEQVDTGFGTFGQKTENAVKAFQKLLGVAETGVFGVFEQTAAQQILTGIGKGSSATQLVKILQNRLVTLNYLTQAQIDTGFGTFGNQTDGAVKHFQKDNLLPESGVIEAVTFKMLFAVKEAELSQNKDIFEPQNTATYDIKPNAEVFFTKKLETKLAAVAGIYFAKTQKKFVVTSGYRPPELQAPAMYNKIIKDGVPSVRQLYHRSKNAIEQILTAFRNNQNDKNKAIQAIRETIEKQVSQGINISNHLRSNAVDIRKTANLTVLDKATRQVGGRVVIEGDHYHLELT